jgi:predicted metalloprotease with PDZ domain
MLGSEWQNWRRSLDYYPEGELIWLEVDSIIRQQTHGQRSMDDFCRRFHGGDSGTPKVVPYTFDDVVRTLNEVAPNDWATLLKERVKQTSTHAPLGGIERGGWKLVYNDQPNAFIRAFEKQGKFASLTDSIGVSIGRDGEVYDVIPGSPAFTAGLGPGMKVIAVNSRKYSIEDLRDAIKAAHDTHQPIEVIAEASQFFKTYSIPYYDGEKIPHLERVGGQPDILGNILKPKTGTQ